MVHNCSIVNCQNNSENNPNLKFIRLPKDTNRLLGWLHLWDLIELANGNILCLSNQIICSAHLTHSQFKDISVTNLKRREVTTSQINTRCDENKVTGRSVLLCGTCNTYFDSINDTVKCATCSKLHHKLCVEVKTKDYGEQIKDWRCDDCEEPIKSIDINIANLNLVETLEVTSTEELQKAEIMLLKNENKVLRDRNNYLENQLYLMQQKVNNSEKEIAQTEEANSNFEFILPSGDHQQSIISEGNMEPITGTIEFDNITIEINDSEYCQEDSSIIIEEEDDPFQNLEQEDSLIAIEEEDDSFQNLEQINSVPKTTSSKIRPADKTAVRFICEYCGIQLKNTSYGARHLMIHTGEKPFVCETCGKRYSRKSFLQDHMRSHTGELPFKCEFCDAKFAFPSSCYRHMKNHIDNKRFKCHICDKGFSQKTSLQGHLATHTGEKSVCEFCGWAFAHRRTYLNHVKTHTGIAPKRNVHTNTCVRNNKTGPAKFSCDICNRKFKRKPNLERHLACHLDHEKASLHYACTICDYKTSSSECFKRHMMVHGGEKPHACKLCDWKFLLRATLQRHMLTHTGEKPFTCLVCNKSFSQKTSLQLHSKIHTGEKNFECTVCEYRCSSKGQLTKHVVIHSSVKPFVCDVCDKRFLRKIELRKHSSIHNKDNVW